MHIYKYIYQCSIVYASASREREREMVVQWDNQSKQAPMAHKATRALAHLIYIVYGAVYIYIYVNLYIYI